MSASAFDELVILPVPPCEPWCIYGAEEHAEQHPDDRSCWSEYKPVTVSRGKPERYSDGLWRHPWVDVYLRREVGETIPVVCLHDQATDKEIVLTVVEAEELIVALERLIRVA